MSTKKPEAHLVDETGWVVHGTWDIELATALVKHADTDVWELPSPVRTWLRTRPGHPSEEYRFYYCAPKVPGERGAFRAVEFPEPMFHGQKTVCPMGIRAEEAK